MEMTARRVMAVLLAVVIAGTGLTALTTTDVQAGASTTFKVLNFDYNRENVYSNYIKKYENVVRPTEGISISAGNFTACSNPQMVIAQGSIDGVNDVVEFKEDEQWAEYTINVPEDSLYSISFKAKGQESIKNDIEFSVEINGVTPFNEAGSITSFRGWKNSDKEFSVKTDENGNQSAKFVLDRANDLRPTQVKDLKWRNCWVEDPAGLVEEPFSFYLHKGVNKIRFKTVGEPFYMAEIKLAQYEQPKPYAEVKKEYEEKGYKVSDKQIKIQAETADEFSNSSLYPISVRNNSQMEPYDSTKTKINATGGSNWGSSRTWLNWDINVPETGLYQLGIKFRQNEYEGMFATRSIYVDGKIPFKEMKYVRFDYNSDWQYKLIGSNNEPCYVYLEKGQHSIKMQVTLGEMASIVESLTNVVSRLNSIYSSIVMLASTSPDTYRDYYFDKNIPNLTEELTWARDEMKKQKDLIISISGTGSSQTATLDTFVKQLDILIKQPDNFNIMLSSFKDNISSLSQWIINNQKQPVKIDYFVLGGKDLKLDAAEPNFFKNFYENTKTFFASFVEDYNVVGEVQGEGKKVRVWVNTGRDQINIINGMIQDSFTPKTGINVQLELVQGSIIEATLAGKGPDVALMNAADQPVNFAIRGALVDLSKYEDFYDVYKRFLPASFEGYAFQMNKNKQEAEEHKGEKWTCKCGTVNTGDVCTNCGYKKYYAYYAVPETLTYNMLFYRKDILSQLGLGVPETWDDFFALLPVLRRNNLQVGVLAPVMFQVMLYQNGGTYYKADKKSSDFESDAAKDSFIKVTDCFTKYNFPQAFDFYTRFRSGEMPLSIQPYTQFNLVNAAAPEIRGLWDMTKVPGTVMPDGKINNSQVTSSAGCVMFEKTKDKDAAWQFIKWYTGNEQQARYGVELESLMGPAGRYAAANLSAFGQLSWTRQQTKLLKEQMSELKGVPEVPGSYYTARALTLAFNDAYIEMENPYKALSERTEELNEEIARKYQEFGLK
ncbi:MAG: extracellular solute-binding protein [Bacillota bacterium]|nr:extracellular solute-binding protein [Bacillota bacterium]